jgi:hypothetical protein
VDDEARLTNEPALDRGSLVRGRVVDDHVHGEALRGTAVHEVQEPAELLGAVVLREIGDDAPGGNVEGRVEVRRPMPAVVVGASLGAAREQRQDRGRAIQDLDLRLLTCAEHDRGVRRIPVERDDVAYLVDELRVGGELEALREVELQGERRQMRLTALCDMPVAWASERVDQ